MKTTLLFLSVFLTTALFGQNVYIPDATFKNYLVGNPNINTNGDTEIQVSEANAYIYGIYIPSQQIYDVTGIEAFTSLTEFRIPFCNCTSIDLSQNTALEILDINGNSLTNLDVSQNTLLEEFSCGSNELTSLDVSQNTALTELICYGNQLTSLDVSQNIALESLWCQSNQLTSLDVSQNTLLEGLSCRNNQLTSLDVSQNTLLEGLSCYNNQLTSLDVSQNTLLEGLSCENNELTSLDVSQNTALLVLHCSNNQLSSLDLCNTPLVDLDCNDNQLTFLDLSTTTNFEELNCWNNQLTGVNLANGNNITTSGMSIEFWGNPNLTCVQIDNLAWAIANINDPWDPQPNFSEDCNFTEGCFNANLTELTTSKNLIQILDLMGRETSFKPNTPLIYVYDDGSTEKVFTIE